MTRSALLAGTLVLFTAGCDEAALTDTPVRATLDDGQVLMGLVQTETLLLEAGMGLLEVPLADVGEVRPVEGGSLAGSANHVSVWLRNGTELRGEWAQPELAMDLSIAGQLVGVDLPVAQLERFQLQGGEATPEGRVYRVRTVWGDDFIVDAEQTWVGLDNELGSFTPSLAEIRTLEPYGSGTWRMALDTGTVLIGTLSEEALTLALPLGPETVEVPVDAIVSLERQDWSGYSSWQEPEPAEQMAPASAIDSGEQGAGVMAAPRPSKDSGGQWFDNRRQSSFKAVQ